jgi:hypothetical protein
MADAPAMPARRRVSFPGPSEFGLPEEDQAAEDAILLSYNEAELAWLMGTNVTRYRRYLEITGQLPEGGVPVVVDVPYASQSEGILNCTMGNWQNEPSSWMVDGAPAGNDANTYTVQAADVGKVATCTVTATNAEGATEAPPSNAITIVEPVVRQAAVAPKEEHAKEEHPRNGRRTRHEKDEDDE